MENGEQGGDMDSWKLYEDSLHYKESIIYCSLASKGGITWKLVGSASPQNCLRPQAIHVPTRRKALPGHSKYKTASDTGLCPTAEMQLIVFKKLK
jgi:hypothetical protein